jgi:magnesium-transporting ATPase (P-type)
VGLCEDAPSSRLRFRISISHFRQLWELAVTDVRDERGLRGFLDRGGFWRLMLVVLVYLAIYLGAGWVASQIAPDAVKADLLSSVGSVFFHLTFGLIVGAVVLVISLSATGWWRDLFARQPIGGSRWMWIAVIIIATPVVLRLFGMTTAGTPPASWHSSSPPVC